MSRKIYFLLLSISAALMIVTCSPEDREHLNFFDPANDVWNRRIDGVVSFDSEYYVGTENSALITLYDPDLMVNTNVTIRIRSTSDNIGILLTLYGNAGIFKGYLNFSLSESSESNNTILISHLDSLTAIYNDTYPQGTRIGNASWYFSGGTAGTASLNNSFYNGTNMTPIVSINDADLYGSTHNVKITSSSDPIGITLACISNPLDGTYTNIFMFTTGSSISNEKLHIENGDIVTVTYNDELPEAARIDTAQFFFDGYQGSIWFNSSYYLGTGSTNTALIYLQDLDLSGPTNSVRVYSDSDTTGITFTLYSNNNDQYTNHLYFITNSGSYPLHLKVDDGDTIYVDYTETSPPRTITDYSTWYKPYVPPSEVYIQDELLLIPPFIMPAAAVDHLEMYNNCYETSYDGAYSLKIRYDGAASSDWAGIYFNKENK